MQPAYLTTPDLPNITRQGGSDFRQLEVHHQSLDEGSSGQRTE